MVIADFVEEVGKATAAELKCEFHRTDVTKREDWESLKRFVDEKYGKLDCVVRQTCPITKGQSLSDIYRSTTRELHTAIRCVSSVQHDMP